ncbi:MAG: hypothetical protein KAW02_01290 [candidate division Zixibacteria bacterium]|nr:hypothetical protein [candidate division Zixibacteria bacterium]
MQAQSSIQTADGIEWGAYYPADAYESASNLKDDSADVAVPYTTAYPGSKNFLVAVLLKNPTPIAGFDFEITITPPNLADFSTVRIYVDSMDTCPAPEETCWVYFPIRECLVVPGAVIEDWSFFEAHGAPGDTTRPDCDILWVLGLALTGTPIPPQPNYVSLFKFGVDVSCVPDSLTDRTVTFDMTGHLSDPFGQLVPFRVHPGELTIWRSVPGDASNDSLVDLGDVIFLINYLYKNGSDPCVMEAADPNADCKADLGDVIYLINFLYREGPPPKPGCAH